MKNNCKMLRIYLILLLFQYINSFHTIKSTNFNIKTIRNLNYNHLKPLYTTSSDPESITGTQNQKILNEIREKLNTYQYIDAYQILKRNPLVPLSIDDGKLFLNNIDELIPYDVNPDQRQQQITDASSFIYKRLVRQNVLRGYGCVDGEYPEKDTDITPSKLEEITGLSINAFTPKERSTYWRLSGVLLCLIEYIVADSIGIDPVYTVIPLTLFFIIGDQAFLKGAVSETIYQTVVPEYKQKVICHEAGHFLLSYLLGVPVRGCVTSAWESRKYPEIRGQAGTIFYDTKLADEIANQKVTRSSLDRLSIIIMAGIAAEALKFNKAEGGSIDEKSLIEFLSTISPPWNILRIQGQARWAATQAILLIKEHINSYNALVDALNANKGVGDCIVAIESNLPINLPSNERIQKRILKEKNNEVDILMRYIQRMTWRVGGIMSNSKSNQTISSDGFIIQNQSIDQNLSQNNTVDNKVNVTTINNSDIAVKQFITRIRQMENAVKDNIISIPENYNGGLWLNNLSTYNNTSTNQSDATIESNPIENLLDISLSEPLPGYIDNIQELQSNGTLPILNDEIDREVDTFDDTDYHVDSLLRSHRGYMMKQLENIQYEMKQKAISIDQRLKTINEELLVKPGKK